MLGTVPQAADEVKSLRTPIDQAELSSIQNSFMKAVRAVKKEAEAEMPPTRQLTAQAMKSIYAELTKGGQRLNRKSQRSRLRTRWQPPFPICPVLTRHTSGSCSSP